MATITVKKSNGKYILGVNSTVSNVNYDLVESVEIKDGKVNIITKGSMVSIFVKAETDPGKHLVLGNLGKIDGVEFNADENTIDSSKIIWDLSQPDQGHNGTLSVAQEGFTGMIYARYATYNSGSANQHGKNQGQVLGYDVNTDSHTSINSSVVEQATVNATKWGVKADGVDAVDKYIVTASAVDKYIVTASPVDKYVVTASAVDKYVVTASAVDKYIVTASAVDKVILTGTRTDITYYYGQAPQETPDTPTPDDPTPDTPDTPTTPVTPATPAAPVVAPVVTPVATPVAAPVVTPAIPFTFAAPPVFAVAPAAPTDVAAPADVAPAVFTAPAPAPTPAPVAAPAPAAGVLGANRPAGNGGASAVLGTQKPTGSVLGARRDADTADASGMAGWLSAFAASTSILGTWTFCRKKREED